MKIKYTIITIIVWLSGYEVTFGQMQMGIAHDNINVTEKIRLNPAHAVDPRPWLDINVIGFYMFGASNAAYLEAEEFKPFKGQIPNSLGQNYDVNKVNGQIEAMIAGPAVNVSLGKYSIGVSSAFRNYAVGRKIPKEFAQGLIYGLQIPEYYGDTLSGDNYRAKFMSFIEVGVNGGMIIHQKGNNVINLGVNFKYHIGIGGLSFLADNFSYAMHDSIDATVTNFTGKYGGSDIGFHPGTGASMDLGFVYQKKVAPSRYYKPHSPQSNCKYIDYKYKIGLSILDIGFINFKGSYYREAQNASGDWPNYADTRGSNVGDIITGIDNIFDQGITESSNKYKAGLPLSFVFQYDYNFGRGLLINGTLVYGAGFQNTFGAERTSMIAITPRYEGKRFGISTPLSFNSMGRGGIGLGLRFWYLTLGTDNLASYLINMDVYRLDVYAHLKIPIFTNPNCKKRGQGEIDWRFGDCSAPGARNPRRKSKR